MALKRTAETVSCSVVKKVCFSENTMKDSYFTPDNVPENVFHLGERNYVVVSDFSDVIRIHIRFYKPDFSGCLKPTKRGVTLTTSLWQALSGAMDFISLDELNEMVILKRSLLLSSESISNVSYISIQRFFQKSDLSHKFLPCSCLISVSEWNELKKIRDEITSFAVQTMFGRVFKGLLLCEVKKRIPSSFVLEDSTDSDILLSTSMCELLRDYLSSNIEEIFICNGCNSDEGNQLAHECVTQNNDMRARIYGNRALLKTDLNNFVRDYVDRNIQICNYINDRFLESLNMSNIIKTAVDLYVASDPNPLRIF